MKHLVVLAALLTSATVAQARPIMIPPPPAPAPAPVLVDRTALQPFGQALIEIRRGSETSAASETVRVMSTGMVITIRRDADGRMIGRDRSFLDRRSLRQVRRALHAATWSVTESPIRCFAYDPTFTDYVVHGDVMLRDQLCSGRAPDADTAQALATINAVLDLRARAR